MPLGGAWAGDSVDAASAIFSWFYDDGWGGRGSTPNFACANPTASGCWGHRDELLGKWAGTTCNQCIAGAGYSSPAANNWEESYDFLISTARRVPDAPGLHMGRRSRAVLAGRVGKSGGRSERGHRPADYSQVTRRELEKNNGR